MRILSTFTMAGMMLAAASAMAQEQTVASFYMDEEIPGMGYGMSPNGKYAVGCGEGVVSNNSFIWSHETGKFTDVFGLSENGFMVDGTVSYLYDISNDGTAVGAFENGPAAQEGKSAPVVPGYYKDGKWTALPLLTDALPGDANGCAVKISADGRVIGGYVTSVINTTEFQGSTLMGAGPKVPVLWIDGEIQRVDECNYQGQGSMVRGMSDDGSVMVGWAEWEDGSRAPAVFTDGKIIRIMGTEPATSNPDRFPDYYDGIAYGVTSDGSKVGGYFAADGLSIDGFIWDVPAEITDTLIEEEEVTHVGSLSPTSFDNEGRAYMVGAQGSSTSIYADGETSSFISYFNVVSNSENYASPAGIYDVSDDCTTFATSYVMSTTMGPVQMPMVVKFEEKMSGVASVASDGLALAYADGLFTVEGVHGGIEVYTTNGTMMMQAGANVQQLDLGSLASGVYLVKVAFDGGFKVMKVLVD